MRTAGIVLAGIAAAVTVVMLTRPSAERTTPARPGVTQPSRRSGKLEQRLAACPLAEGFVFPVGPPDARGYYNAQPFGKNGHLGEDWNGNGGGNTDLGDPIHAIAEGIVFSVGDAGPGWGNVVRLYHNIGTKEKPQFVESLYGHLKTVEVSAGDVVGKGQRLGSMGNVDGRYYAHLHLEVRTKIGMGIRGGYSDNSEGFVEPTKFIRSHRQRKKNANHALQPDAALPATARP